MTLPSTPARVLFCANGSLGHVYPLLPLARAFARRGDEVAVMTSAGAASVLAAEGLPHLSISPTPQDSIEQLSRRTGSGFEALREPTPQVVAELFVGIRLDLGAAEALDAGRTWRPDLVVCEIYDVIGPYLAAALDVPLATVPTGPMLPEEFLTAFATRAQPFFTDAFRLPAGQWLLDIVPDSLGAATVTPPRERWTLRPEPHREPGWVPTSPYAGLGDRPRVLVAFGSVFADPALIGGILDDLAAGVDADLVGVALPGADPAAVPHRAENVTVLPFQSFADLLDGVSVLVTHGGAGSVLGALARGVPLVVAPQGADQMFQAEAVTRAGCGVSLPLGRPDAVALRDAVGSVLENRAYAEAAARIEKDIAAMSSPDEVAEALVTALPGR